VVVVPSTSARDGVAAAGAGDRKLWKAGVGTSLALCAVFALVPAEHDLVRYGIVYPVTEALAVAAIVYGVLRYRPSAPSAWLLIAGGLATWLAGDLIWAYYLFKDESPFPSPADFFYLAGYLVIVGGLLVAVRRRAAGVDMRSWLDAGMFAVVSGLFAWIFLVEPTIDDPSISAREAFVSASYVAGDLLLLLVAVRFVMGISWRFRSLELLVLGLCLTLAGDVVFQLALDSARSSLGSGDTLLLLGIACFGAAGLHETMPALTEPIRVPSKERYDDLRLVLLTACCLIPPAVLLVEWASGTGLHLVALVVTTVLISLLAVARAEVAARRAMRTAQRESLLGSYASDLMRADDEEELYGMATRTAASLIDDGSAAVVPADGQAAAHAFSVPVEARGEHVADLVADADLLTIRRNHYALGTVADELSLALEREQLRKREQEALAALSAQNERLLELDRMKDQFVSTITHELRTPLSSMVGYLEMLTGSDVGELSKEERERFLGIVDRNCRRLNRLVDDILTVARIDSARFSLERRNVDVVRLASERVESIRATAEQRIVGVELTVENPPPPLYADPMRLGQLLDNLLSNAVKFSPEGGTVRLNVGSNEDTVHIEVADSGVGIPADEQDELFTRFFRASTASTVQGTGLGLSIAKSIVEAHGGTITVASEVGVGTTFSVDLPVQAPQETAGKGEAAR
jgi:signal transduction histidine kinase